MAPDKKTLLKLVKDGSLSKVYVNPREVTLVVEKMHLELGPGWHRCHSTLLNLYEGVDQSAEMAYSNSNMEQQQDELMVRLNAYHNELLQPVLAQGGVAGLSLEEHAQLEGLLRNQKFLKSSLRPAVFASFRLGLGPVNESVVRRPQRRIQYLATTSMVDHFSNYPWTSPLRTKETKKNVVAALVFQDNQSTIKLFKNQSHSHRTKHIDIRMSFVEEREARKFIQIEYLPTEAMMSR